MKKKILSVAFVAAIAIVGGLSFNQNKTNISDLTLNNIEALANGEDSGTNCGKFSGACWVYNPWMDGPFWRNCRYSGNQNDYCY